MIAGSLEVKLPTIWTDGKAEVGRVREEKRREEERRSEKRKSQRKEDAGARKGRNVGKPFVRAPVFPANFGPHFGGPLAQAFLSHAVAKFHLGVPASGAFH